MTSSEEPLIACDLSALDNPEQHKARGEQLFASAEEMDELDDGYAWRYPAAPEWTERIAAFIQGEQQCCPFFRFEMLVEPATGATWLRLRGNDRVKGFLERGMDL